MKGNQSTVFSSPHHTSSRAATGGQSALACYISNTWSRRISQLRSPALKLFWTSEILCQETPPMYKQVFSIPIISGDPQRGFHSQVCFLFLALHSPGHFHSINSLKLPQRLPLRKGSPLLTQSQKKVLVQVSGLFYIFMGGPEPLPSSLFPSHLLCLIPVYRLLPNSTLPAHSSASKWHLPSEVTIYHLKFM